MSTAAGLNYERRGSGEPMLLVHGLGGELTVWKPVFADLACTYDVIAVDLPGFGASGSPAGGAQPTAAGMAAALGPFLDELGVERAHLVGSSLGAWVTFELALLGRARSVVALAPAGLWDEPLRLRDERALRWLGRRLIPLAPLLFRSRSVRKLVFRWTVADGERIDPASAVRMARSYLHGPAYLVADAAMRRGRFTAEEGLTVPVTIVWCGRDRQIDPPARELPWATIKTLPQCGHLPMWDDPPATVAVIRAAVAAAEHPESA